MNARVENHSPLQFPEGYVYVDVTLEGPYEFVIGTDWRSQHISEVYTEDEFWDNDNLPPNRHQESFREAPAFMHGEVRKASADAKIFQYSITFIFLTLR